MNKQNEFINALLQHTGNLYLVSKYEDEPSLRKVRLRKLSIINEEVITRLLNDTSLSKKPTDYHLEFIVSGYDDVESYYLNWISGSINGIEHDNFYTNCTFITDDYSKAKEKLKAMILFKIDELEDIINSRTTDIVMLKNKLETMEKNSEIDTLDI